MTHKFHVMNSNFVYKKVKMLTKNHFKHAGVHGFQNILSSWLGKSYHNRCKNTEILNTGFHKAKTKCPSIFNNFSQINL